ncbi:Rieske 2Fe-2S domain-containing protein [Endozoicomonas arenosclerae]|uniref:Rieske 2Fe-2S domain-containing protein n=1 Tax=Endozoicomonas arenosclerae TaxID=1633495 RepID=UPI0007836CDE|nr:Rieske 2Fe-2S domain-containing protein [Endozoicomonas arenosclerae]
MSKRYNKPIPYGWYCVELSKNLEAGDVKPLKYFGEDLVLFRTESGEAKVLDAYCPHLGAHLGHGGIVKGESVSCPFHAWEFDGTGMLQDIPYSKRIPPKVKGKPCIRSYPVQEKNEMIWAWYHPEEAEPLFELEVMEEFGHPDWTDIDVYEWKINSIVQETGENAADLAHFVTVHDSPFLPDGKVTYEDHKRITIMDNETNVMDENGVVDRSGENLEPAHLYSFNNGPGQTGQRFTRMFEIVMMGTITPIDDQSIHMRFVFSLPKAQTAMNVLYAHGVRDEIVHQVNQDIPIWEHKIYKEQPILCEGDGPIGQYRKWFEQFYVKPETTSIQETEYAEKERLIVSQ